MTDVLGSVVLKYAATVSERKYSRDKKSLLFLGTSSHLYHHNIHIASSNPCHFKLNMLGY